MTLAELAVTLGMLGGLGLVASRVGLSAIPAYLLAGLLLGPNEPTVVTLISPSEVTEFVAEVGIIFLLFFLGLEFTLTRLSRSRRHVVFGGLFDLVANAGLGLLVGVAAFGFSFAALILAAAIYVSSSAIAVKGLIDFRRLADDETDLVLAILIAEDIAMALVLGFAAGGGGELGDTLAIVAKAIGFIARALAGVATGSPAQSTGSSTGCPRVLPAGGVRLPRRDGCDRGGARPFRGDRRPHGRRRPVRDLRP